MLFFNLLNLIFAVLLQLMVTLVHCLMKLSRRKHLAHTSMIWQVLNKASFNHYIKTTMKALTAAQNMMNNVCACVCVSGASLQFVLTKRTMLLVCVQIWWQWACEGRREFSPCELSDIDIMKLAAVYLPSFTLSPGSSSSQTKWLTNRRWSNETSVLYRRLFVFVPMPPDEPSPQAADLILKLHNHPRLCQNNNEMLTLAVIIAPITNSF